jgi:subtilase family serine protease
MLARVALAAAAAAVAQAAHLTAEAQRAGWKEVGRAAPADTKSFMVGMAMKDVALLEATLLELATPGSARYGKWLSRAEADELTSTPAAVAAEATRWATSTGAACKRLSEALSCSASVAQIEALLGGELSYFVNAVTGEKLVRTSMHAPGSVPAALEGKVTVVTGLTQLPLKAHRAGAVRPEAAYRAQDTDYSVVPETLNILYSHQGADDSSLSVGAGPIEFQGYPAIIQTDDDTFAKNVGLPTWTIPKNQTVGPFAPGAGAESALDEQYVVAMSPSANKWYWTEADWQVSPSKTPPPTSLAPDPNHTMRPYFFSSSSAPTCSPPPTRRCRR